MDPTIQLDAAGRRRSPATLPGYHSGRAPGNKGRRYPADPPRVEEIVAVMRQAGERPGGLRVRGLIVVLWRAGLRVSEALALSEGDLEPGRGAMLVRHGKGGRRREVGMDDWGWRQLEPWLKCRLQLPVGALLRHQRTYGWTALVAGRGANAVSTPCQAGGRSPSLRPPPATSRSCSRDGAGRRSPERDPTPARTRGPRDYLGLPAGNRQRRDR
jgi:integrase